MLVDKIANGEKLCRNYYLCKCGICLWACLTIMSIPIGRYLYEIHVRELLQEIIKLFRIIQMIQQLLKEIITNKSYYKY